MRGGGWGEGWRSWNDLGDFSPGCGINTVPLCLELRGGQEGVLGGMDDGADGRAVVRASTVAKTRTNSAVKDQPVVRGRGRTNVWSQERTAAGAAPAAGAALCWLPSARCAGSQTPAWVARRAGQVRYLDRRNQGPGWLHLGDLDSEGGSSAEGQLRRQEDGWTCKAKGGGWAINGATLQRPQRRVTWVSCQVA